MTATHVAGMSKTSALQVDAPLSSSSLRGRDNGIKHRAIVGCTNTNEPELQADDNNSPRRVNTGSKLPSLMLSEALEVKSRVALTSAMALETTADY